MEDMREGDPKRGGRLSKTGRRSLRGKKREGNGREGKVAPAVISKIRRLCHQDVFMGVVLCHDTPVHVQSVRVITTSNSRARLQEAITEKCM